MSRLDAANTALAVASTALIVPAIGQLWPGQGGWFAGIVGGLAGAPDQFLILADATPLKDLAWSPACIWAKKLRIDGHKDFSLPDRRESRLLWINLKDRFEPSWYWTSEQYSRTGAWYQYFDGGGQINGGKSYEGRARAVRRFNVQSLSHSSVQVAA